MWIAGVFPSPDPCLREDWRSQRLVEGPAACCTLVTPSEAEIPRELSGVARCRPHAVDVEAQCPSLGGSQAVRKVEPAKVRPVRLWASTAAAAAACSKLNHSDELPNFQCQELLRADLTSTILPFYLPRAVPRARRLLLFSRPAHPLRP
jgi:hypothetical protein